MGVGGRGEDGGGLGSLPSSPRGIKYNCKQPNKWGMLWSCSLSLDYEFNYPPD